MSLIIDKTTTPTEQLQQMDIDLHISVPIESKSVKNYKTKIIELTPYRIMNNLVFIPMSYGIKKISVEQDKFYFTRKSDNQMIMAHTIHCQGIQSKPLLNQIASYLRNLSS